MGGSRKISQLAGKDSEDLALLELIAAEDRDALTDLYARYHARLFKFVFRLTRSHTAADELVNDIMLAVWRSARNFRGDSKPSTWIFGIAYRQALKRLSRKKLSIASYFEVDHLPDNDARSIEQEDWVELVFFLGLSYDEVAAVTDCPVNTVKTRMFHARRKLREKLQTSASAADSQGEEK